MGTTSDRRAKALALIPAAHLAPPQQHELLSSKEAGFQSLQDYAFSQRFCMAVSSDDVNAGRQMIGCTRHKKSTKDRRKLDKQGTRKRATAVLAVDCNYSITVAFSKRRSRWWLVTTCLQHNHEMSEDPLYFQPMRIEIHIDSRRWRLPPV
jgi:hypothetical protein